MNNHKAKRNIYLLFSTGVILLIILAFFSPNSHNSPIQFKDHATGTENRGDIRIMFYNTENFFDTENDPLTEDEAFTPEGDRHWTPYKYDQKLNNIYKVIANIGGWKSPSIVGLCEIENRGVLEDLIHQTPLSKDNYTIIHKNSPDERGIDVGLLYKKKVFRVIDQQFIPVTFSFAPDVKTRDILHVKGIIEPRDTLHLFVNHWPSRYGGRLESQPKRVHAARILKQHVDSVVSNNKNARVVIMGDFNDEPHNKSLNDILNAQTEWETIRPDQLYNLSGVLQDHQDIGSYKYKGHWNMLDQFIVSGNLLLDTSSLYTEKNSTGIFHPDYLLEEDQQNVGQEPYRTFLGYKYNGGFSDHLPVYLDLYQE